MALRRSPRIAGIVLLDAVGIDTGSPERSIVDPTKVPLPQLLTMSFHDPKKFAVPTSSPEATEARAQNQRTLRVYSGETLHARSDLRPRLAELATPTLVVWGESDRIVDLDYGRLFAKSIPGSRFEVVPQAGHLPHIERLEDTARLIGDFTARL